MADFINTIERAIIDQLRTDFSGFTVYGQYPEAIDVSYPCIIVEQLANGSDTQFYGQNATFGGSDKTGEIYGLAFRFHVIVDKTSSKYEFLIQSNFVPGAKNEVAKSIPLLAIQ